MGTFRGCLAAAALALVIGAPAWAARPKLESIKAEADLEKRSKLSLELARKTVDDVIKAFEAGRPDEGRELLKMILDAVIVADEALEETGKDPRKKPKHFKRAEIETRKLLSDLEDAKRRLTFDEGPDVEKIQKRVEKINQGLLMGIMAPKKR